MEYSSYTFGFHILEVVSFGTLNDLAFRHEDRLALSPSFQARGSNLWRAKDIALC